MDSEARRRFLDRLHENGRRLDQLRRTYADISVADFYGVFFRMASEGMDAACDHVRRTFGPRAHEAVMRTAQEILAAEGPGLTVGPVEDVEYLPDVRTIPAASQATSAASGQVVFPSRTYLVSNPTGAASNECPAKWWGGTPGSGSSLIDGVVGPREERLLLVGQADRGMNGVWIWKGSGTRH